MENAARRSAASADDDGNADALDDASPPPPAAARPGPRLQSCDDDDVEALAEDDDALSSAAAARASTHACVEGTATVPIFQSFFFFRFSDERKSEEKFSTLVPRDSEAIETANPNSLFFPGLLFDVATALRV